MTFLPSLPAQGTQCLRAKGPKRRRRTRTQAFRRESVLGGDRICLQVRELLLTEQAAEKSEALDMPLSDDFSVSQANATDSTVPHGAALQPAVQRDGGVQPATDEPASPVPRRHSEIRNSFKTCQCLSFSMRKDKRLPRFSLKLEYMQCLKSKNQNFKRVAHCELIW